MRPTGQIKGADSPGESSGNPLKRLVDLHRGRTTTSYTPAVPCKVKREAPRSKRQSGGVSWGWDGVRDQATGTKKKGQWGRTEECRGGGVHIGAFDYRQDFFFLDRKLVSSRQNL